MHKVKQTSWERPKSTPRSRFKKSKVYIFIYTKEHNCENFIKFTVSKKYPKGWIPTRLENCLFPNLKHQKTQILKHFSNFFSEEVSVLKKELSTTFFQAEISTESEFSDCGKDLRFFRTESKKP